MKDTAEQWNARQRNRLAFRVSGILDKLISKLLNKPQLLKGWRITTTPRTIRLQIIMWRRSK